MGPFVVINGCDLQERWTTDTQPAGRVTVHLLVALAKSFALPFNVLGNIRGCREKDERSRLERKTGGGRETASVYAPNKTKTRARGRDHPSLNTSHPLTV